MSAAGTITIGGDLIVTIDVPGGVANSAAGATVTVTDWTRSDNSAPVGASTTKFYLVTGTTLDGERDCAGEPGDSGAGAVDDEHGDDDVDLAGECVGDVPDHREGGRGQRGGGGERGEQRERRVAAVHPGAGPGGVAGRAGGDRRPRRRGRRSR